MSSNACSPADIAQAVDAMKTGGRTLIRGAGTAADWGGWVDAVDTVLDTSELRGLVAYNPADMTLAVLAGTPLAGLQRKLAGHGQWVACDAARVGLGATVGGLLATNDAGPRRHAFGTLRDLVLGVTVVLADGTVSHSGGHVIKNVTGYDLAKLFSGSLGTLGLIAEVVLRVHPLPKFGRTLVVPCEASAAFDAANRLLAEPVEPSAVDWCDGRLLARFDGTEVGVGRQLDHAIGVVGGQPQDNAVWDAVADITNGAPGDTVMRIGALPSHFADIAAAAMNGDADVAIDAQLGAGVQTVRLRDGDAEKHAEFVTTMRSAVADRGGTMALHRRKAGVDELVPSWGGPPAAIDVLRAVKAEFDPDGRLGAGRFAPWF